jgi:hypothetical protein
MHGLTGGGWKRKRYRPRLKRKLPAGKPRQERQTYSRTLATAPAPDPPSSGFGCFGVSALVEAVTAALFGVCEDSRIGHGRRGSQRRP